MNPSSPCRDDRSSQQLYPDLFDPDTSCRKLVLRKTWKPAMQSDRAVTWFETSSPDRHAEARPVLQGRLSCPLAKASIAGKPEVPSTA